MKERLLWAFILTFLFCASAYPQTPLPSKFESWNEVQLILPMVRGKDRSGKTIDKVTATFNGIARFGRKDVDLVDGRVGAALDYRVNRNVSLLTAVLYRRDENVENVRRYETRLDFGVTLSKTWKNFTFRDRNMYEHRYRNGRGDIDLYRNKMQVSHPIKRNDKELFTAWVSDEVYYDMTGRNWSQNEFLAGITRKINQRTSVDIAYIRNDTRPTNVNGLSLALKIKLR